MCEPTGRSPCSIWTNALKTENWQQVNQRHNELLSEHRQNVTFNFIFCHRVLGVYGYNHSFSKLEDARGSLKQTVFRRVNRLRHALQARS